METRANEKHLIDLIEQYEESLLRMCCVYLRDAALAQDAVQETFVKAYRKLDSFRGDCSEKSWLMRIAINTCKDMLRTSWFHFVDRSVQLEHIPEATSELSLEEMALSAAVMKLPHKYMDVVLLYYYQGLTIREISQSLKISERTTSYRLQQARVRLRNELEGGQHSG